jgi:hypothetical protein
MERKCWNCGHWNTNEAFCVSCGSPIAPNQVRKVRKEKREKNFKVDKSKLDEFAEKWKNTNNVFLKLLYKVAYLFWMLYIGIISFILWFIALGPG